MVRLWALCSDDEKQIDDEIYINPLVVNSVRGNGQGYSIVYLTNGWYVVQGKPESIRKRIQEALENM